MEVKRLIRFIHFLTLQNFPVGNRTFLTIISSLIFVTQPVRIPVKPQISLLNYPFVWIHILLLDNYSFFSLTFLLLTLFRIIPCLSLTFPFHQYFPAIGSSDFLIFDIPISFHPLLFQIFNHHIFVSPIKDPYSFLTNFLYCSIASEKIKFFDYLSVSIDLWGLANFICTQEIMSAFQIRAT